MNELGVCTIVPTGNHGDIVGPKTCEEEVKAKDLKEKFGKKCPPLPRACKAGLKDRNSGVGKDHGTVGH